MLYSTRVFSWIKAHWCHSLSFFVLSLTSVPPFFIIFSFCVIFFFPSLPKPILKKTVAPRPSSSRSTDEDIQGSKDALIQDLEKKLRSKEARRRNSQVSTHVCMYVCVCVCLCVLQTMLEVKENISICFVSNRNCLMRSVWLAGCWVQTTPTTC